MYKLMKLPYSYDALKPDISALTVDIHYNKHHMDVHLRMFDL